MKIELVRELPAGLVTALHRARDLEALAARTGGLRQQRQAITGTGALLLAAVEAGWSQAEIADALAMNRQTVQKRVAVARSIYGDHAPALVFDAPLDKPPHPLAVLDQPVEQREWLSVDEAAELAGRHRYTIRNWRVGGLLPNTQHPTAHVYLYLRADVVRVIHAPRYRSRGVNYRALRAEIDEAPV